MSATAIPVTVALVDQTGRIDQADLAEVAAALAEQAHTDLAPVWHGHFTRCQVQTYPRGNVPAFTWQLILRQDLAEAPGALGYHTDTNGQPVSYVDAITRNGRVDPNWTVTASHELAEMLADPYGSRPHTARHPEGVTPAQIGLTGSQVRVTYLVEVADPPEAASYEVGGVPVSDFLTPDWYRTSPRAGIAYSRLGTCQRPRQVADGGYVSFATPDGVWWQLLNFGSPQLKRLGRFDAQKDEQGRPRFRALREFTDHHSRLARREHATP